ncbi:MAG TPA: hypothetical protein VI653_28625 [Steroidobacteraceae bacterium]
MTGDGHKVQRAIFGDVRGAHKLVMASPGLPEALLADLAAHYTDRLLSSEHAWTGYRCGFPVKGYYVLTQTFAVKATRGGMVQTHALIIPLTSVGTVQDLEDLARLLPSEAVGPEGLASAVEPLFLPPHSAGPAPSAPLGYLPVVRLLLQDRIPVWVGQAGFWEVVAHLWRELWPAARERLHFRMGSEPGETERSATLLCTLVETKTHWDTRSFVDQSAPLGANLTPAEAFLAGAPESLDIVEARARLGFALPKISDIKRLVDYVAQLKEDSANSVRSAARLLGQLAPELAQNADEKDRVIRRLGALSAAGSETDLLGLRNLNISGFAGAEGALSDAICAWMRVRVHAGTGGVSVARDVFLETRDWDGFARPAVVKAFTPWEAGHTRILWSWWTTEPALIEATRSLLPSAADRLEEALIQSMPSTLTPQTHEPLLRLAKERLWYLLHALVLAKAVDLPVLDRLRRQIQIDTVPGSVEGLEYLAEVAAPAELIQAAVDIEDGRLVRLAAAAVRGNSSLLAPIDPKRPAWQAIWDAAVGLGADLYAGVADIPKLAQGLLSAALENGGCPAALLEHVLSDPRSQLLGFPQRAQAWTLVSSVSVREAAVRLVAGQWLDGFLSGKPFDATQLEPVLESAVLKLWRDTRRRHPAASVVAMHRRFPSLGETDVVGWLSETPHARSTVDATALGDLILESEWSRAAGRLGDVVLGRSGNLDAAIHRCVRLLGRWRRLRISLDVPELTPSDDEWWEEFVERASLLFPGGVNDGNIWWDSGGDTSFIVLSASGRDQWAQALHLLRQGGGGQYITVDGLLHQMRNRFQNNTDLEALEQVYLRRIRRSSP